jgi:hypothetical protein
MNGEGSHEIFSDIQIVNCQMAFNGVDGSNLKVENCLCVG